jgi:hypothetical protein
MKYLKSIGIWLLQGIAGVIFIGFTALMLVEWAAGCGETYIDSKGIRHQHECLFINR